ADRARQRVRPPRRPAAGLQHGRRRLRRTAGHEQRRPALLPDLGAGMTPAGERSRPMIRAWLAPLALLLWIVAASAAQAAGAPEAGRLVSRDYHTGHVYAVDTSGANLADLTAGADDGFNLQPSWTPDGNGIVFSSFRNGEQQLWQMDADGRDPHVVLA